MWGDVREKEAGSRPGRGRERPLTNGSHRPVRPRVCRFGPKDRKATRGRRKRSNKIPDGG